jgi:hypothetical protein
MNGAAMLTILPGRLAAVTAFSRPQRQRGAAVLASARITRPGPGGRRYMAVI